MNHQNIEGLEVSQNKWILKPFQDLAAAEDIKAIIEIGTYQGGFALFLRQIFPLAYILTVDYEIHAGEERIEIFAKNDIDFEHIHYQEPSAMHLYRAALELGQTLILCDNGVKSDEISYLAPHMNKGDIIGVHDYALSREDFEENIMGVYWNCVECTREQISDTIIYNKLTEYKPELFRQAVWGLFKK